MTKWRELTSLKTITHYVRSDAQKARARFKGVMPYWDRSNILEFVNETIQFLNFYFRPLLICFASAFAIYFACLKIGNKVTARYEVSNGIFFEEYISKIVLANKKDKPVSIWSIHVVFEKDLQLELDKFNPPLVLKPFETTGISLTKYSELHIGSDTFMPRYIHRDIKLYADIGDSLLELGSEVRKNSLSVFSEIAKSTRLFNGHVYNSDVAYFLCYYYDDSEHTAFIDKSGIIGNEWGFRYNNIGKSNPTPKEVEKFLVDAGLSEIFTNYFCVKTEATKDVIVFRKKISEKA